MAHLVEHPPRTQSVSALHFPYVEVPQNPDFEIFELLEGVNGLTQPESKTIPNARNRNSFLMSNIEK